MTLISRSELSAANGNAAKLVARLTASHLHHASRALQVLCDSVRNRTVVAPANPLHLPRIRPGRIQLRFWMLLAAILGADAAAIYAVHALVGWVRRVWA